MALVGNITSSLRVNRDAGPGVDQAKHPFGRSGKMNWRGVYAPLRVHGGAMRLGQLRLLQQQIGGVELSQTHPKIVRSHAHSISTWV